MSRSQEVAVFTFGQTPTYQSDENFDLSVSDDNRALTLRFPEFEVTAGAGKSQAPTSTRAFCLVLPLEGDDETAEIEFIATNAFVATTDGATATMVLSANGQTTFADFPANTDQSLINGSSSRHPRHPSVGSVSCSWSDGTQIIPTPRRF
jgi:hypothetical protein